ncbi:MAG: hypothetical protein WCC48_14935, partial [Anaeromyxobacteraceae bacterium]
ARPGARPRAAPRAALPTLEGELEEIDHRAHRLSVRTPGGSVRLSFDRNTFVLASSGAVTPLALAAGMHVKVGRDGEERAAWIELKLAPSTPAAPPP